MSVMPFEFPPGPHVRRHGPYGYTTYQSFRDWLRDEFSFRCVFCLRRELWEVRLGMFHIDHFVPQSIAPHLECEYGNLLYVCSRCNCVKSDTELPDPCAVSFADSMRILPNGEIETLNETGEILVDLLNLNDPDLIRFRGVIINTLNSIKPELEEWILPQWLGYPDDLPNLGSKIADNRKPEGIAESCYERRLRRELPARY